MNYTQLKQHAETCQIAADNIAYKYLKEKELNSKLAVFQNYANFNAAHTLGQFPIYMEAVVFINRNGKDLKRKFELHEFLRFGVELRIKQLIYKIDNFEQFKQIVIKKAKTLK